MKTSMKLIIFVLVLLAVGAIFAVPYFDRGQGKFKEFSTTAQPVEKLQQAAQKGRPVFLEFYSDT